VIRYEQDNPAVRLTGEWYPNANAVHSGGSAALTMDRYAQTVLTFTGTSVKWIGYRDQWSGKAQVYLDGSFQATVDAYASSAQAQSVLYSATGLSASSHTLTIKMTGNRNKRSGGTWVWVDALEVTTVSSPEPPPAPAPPPPTTPTRVEQNNSAVVYSGGAWSTNSTAPHSGGTAVLSVDPGARATLTFTGTAVNWMAYRDEWAGIARVYLDGVLKGEVDTYASPSQAQAVVYSIGGLTRATHTLAIEVKGARNAASGGNWVWVDAFNITP